MSNDEKRRERLYRIRDVLASLRAYQRWLRVSGGRPRGSGADVPLSSPPEQEPPPPQGAVAPVREFPLPDLGSEPLGDFPNDDDFLQGIVHAADSAALAGGEPEVRNLIMITSSAWGWPAGPDAAKAHASRIEQLVAGAEPGTAAFTRVRRPAKATRSTFGGRYGARELSRPEIAWSGGDDCAEAIDRLAADLARVRPGQNRGLAGLQHRVYLHASRLDAVFDTDEIPAGAGALGVHVLLDFSFDWLLGQPTCVLSVSVWQQRPLHREHRPDTAPEDDALAEVFPIDVYRDTFTILCQGVERWFSDPRHEPPLTRTEFRAARRAHYLPTIWVAVPRRLLPDAGDYLHGEHRRLMNSLCDMALGVGDCRDSVLSASVLNGQMLAMRRLIRLDPGRSVPCYLLVPDRFAEGERADLQEVSLGQVVQLLIRLEAEAAQRLYRIQNDLEIWRTHAAVYDRVADRGLLLWDALSTHLPVRRWFRLGRLHRTVELLHQTLLQGTADLAHLATETDACVAQVDSAVQQLVDGFDAEVTAYPLSTGVAPYPGVRDALTTDGVMGEVREDGLRVSAQALRVQAKYRDLIGTIAAAFDERRVRESDALSKASAIMGFGLAVVGVVTVLDATVAMKPQDPGQILLGDAPPWLPKAAALVSLTLGGVFAVVVLAVLASTTRLGRLGSRWFRRMYNGGALSRFALRLRHNRLSAWATGRTAERPWRDEPWREGLWSYLKDSSTGLLGSVAGDRDGPEVDVRRDEDLARRLALLWDRTAKAGLSRRWPLRGSRELRSELIRRDIWLLRRRIEQWSLFTLLLTERPRRMHRHRLPKLTLLYRACSFLPGSFLGDGEISLMTRDLDNQGPRVVSRNDLIMTLYAAGLTWQQAEELDEVLIRRARDIDRGSPEPAAQMLRILDYWEVRPGMDAGQAAAVMSRVRED
ncbi:hypothetical protein [Actinoplanes sp. RD1]|uniref:hypothetical protein n=1 Tax=Actinoplanes sp. RD1 TaxID=3064538 RepID=UPI002740B9B9|nr:hypothetical protein [Actinoplanes sp. RD1]